MGPAGAYCPHRRASWRTALIRSLERWLLITNAAVGFFAGLALLVVPSAFMAVLNIQLDAAGTTMARLYGAELVGFNIATWMSRRLPIPRPIVLGHVANESLTAIAFVVAAIGGLGNALLWPLALTAALFALGYSLVAITRRPSGAAVASR
jgi:hypothetical protein